jgi:hypothetical protein
VTTPFTGGTNGIGRGQTVIAPPPGELLKAGADLELIKFKESAGVLPRPDPASVPNYPNARLAVAWVRIRIEIEYESIYGERDRCIWSGDTDLDNDSVAALRTVIGKHDENLQAILADQERSKD